MKRTNAFGFLFATALLAAACGDASNQGGPGAGGTTGSAGAAGTHAGGTTGGGGAGGGGTGGSAGTGGAGGSGGSAGSGGTGGSGGQPAIFEDLVANSPFSGYTARRPDFGGVIVVSDGARMYAVESRRDIEPGPLGLPWPSRFQVAAYEDAGSPLWTFAAPPDDVISDVAVHPSGDVTIAILHYPPAKLAYDLVRLDRSGAVLGTTTMSEPQTAPATDFGPTDPRPPFRMKSDLADATVGGWVRLLPDGEGLVVAFLSYVDALSTD